MWRKPIHDMIVKTLVRSQLFNDIVHITKNPQNFVKNVNNLNGANNPSSTQRTNANVKKIDYFLN